jgi:hypothetical protein
MIALNPIVKSHTLLPPTSSTAFFASEVGDLKPPTPENVPVYEVTEDMSGSSDSEQGGGSWRGGWAKRFVPDSITYQTSMQCLEDGLRSITHAPMGVHSSTTWLVKQGEGEGLMLEERGRVTSNRMLMGFIKTTLQDSHDKLIRDFMAVLEKEVAGEGNGEVEKVS